MTPGVAGGAQGAWKTLSYQFESSQQCAGSQPLFASHLMKDREKEVHGSPCTQVKCQVAIQIPPFLVQICMEAGMQWLLEESETRKTQNLFTGGPFYTNLKT